MRNRLIYVVLSVTLMSMSMCSRAQQPQRPSDIAINGRMEAQSFALNAVVNDCAVRTGGLYEALEKASKEIERLRTELEAAKKK